MSPADVRIARWCAHFAIVELDIRPLLAVLALAQRFVPIVWRRCGDVHRCVQQFVDAHPAELGWLQAQVESRHYSRSTLIRQGVPPALVKQLLSATTDATLIAIVLPGCRAVLRADDGCALIVDPDAIAVDGALPDASLLVPELPSSPRTAPRAWVLESSQRLPPCMDASALERFHIVDPALLPEALEILGALPALWHLQLESLQGIEAALARLPLVQLRALRIARCGDAAEILGRLLADCPALERLSLRGLSPATLPALSALTAAAHLERVDLMGFGLSGEPPPAAWLALCQGAARWRELRLAYIDADWLRVLLAQPLPALQILELGGRIGSAGIELLCAATLPALTQLGLVDTDIDGPALARLCASTGRPRLGWVAITLYSDEIEDWYDWNGGIVGSGPRRLAAHEIEQRYLAGTGVRILAELQGF